MTSRLPFKTYLYFLSQSINLTTAVMSVTMAALVGASLAPEPWLSTVPYGFQFLFVMLVTFPASKLMALIGRKKSFLLATIPLAGSGITGYIAVQQQAFILLVVSHSLLGVYIAFANFNRFAASDGVAPQLKPRVISLVVAGGVLAAIVGPLLTNQLKDFQGLQAFAACYAAFVGLAVLSLVLNLFIKAQPVQQSTTAKVANRGTGIKQVLKNPIVMLAIAVAAIGYGLMNLLMIQASMHMTGLHVHFSDISTAIQWHVLAMFAPSFFTGVIIQRLGLKTVIYAGILMLLLSSAINISAHDYLTLTVSLIVLGLGWNFTYVGGSALLTLGLEGTADALQIQGLNDLGISVMATAGAFAPALLLALLGWDGTNVLSIVISLILLAFTALVFRHDRYAKAKKRSLA